MIKFIKLFKKRNKIIKIRYISSIIINNNKIININKQLTKYSTNTSKIILKDIFGCDDLNIINKNYILNYLNQLFNSEQYNRILIETNILASYYSYLYNIESINIIYNTSNILNSYESISLLLKNKKKENKDIEIEYLDSVLKYYKNNNDIKEIDNLIDILIYKFQNNSINIDINHLQKSLNVILSRISGNLYKLQKISEIISYYSIPITNDLVNNILVEYHTNKKYEELYTFIQILNTYCEVNITNKCLYYYLLSCAYLDKIQIFLDLDKTTDIKYDQSILLFANVLTTYGYCNLACKYWLKYISDNNHIISTKHYYNALHCFGECKNKDGFKEIILKGLLHTNNPKPIPICTSMMLYDLDFNDISIINTVKQVYKLKTQNQPTYGLLEDLYKKEDKENAMWILQWLIKEIK